MDVAEAVDEQAVSHYRERVCVYNSAVMVVMVM
jgi:hypothetical protein